MLRPLLFVHGRESYRKNSTLVLYNFFKNIILVFPQFWVSVFNNFSGQTPYDSFIYQLFNVFYTSMPIIIFAVFDEEHSRKTLYDHKTNLYRIGLKKELFSLKVFWGWFLNATFQSAVIAFFS
jgi:phospholipid-transporting ATPase